MPKCPYFHFSSGFLTESLCLHVVSPVHDTCPSHLTAPIFISFKVSHKKYKYMQLSSFEVQMFSLASYCEMHLVCFLWNVLLLCVTAFCYSCWSGHSKDLRWHIQHISWQWRFLFQQKINCHFLCVDVDVCVDHYTWTHLCSPHPECHTIHFPHLVELWN